MPLKPGDKLGPCEILAPIGAGGMDKVYRAKDTKLSREVAIKVLPGALLPDPLGTRLNLPIARRSGTIGGVSEIVGFGLTTRLRNGTAIPTLP